MSESAQGQVVSFEAGEAFAAGYVCAKLGTDNKVNLPTTDNAFAVGVIQGIAAEGQAAAVMVSGITKVVAGGVVAIGDKLCALSTTGRVHKAPSISATWTGTANSTENIVGVALTAASADGEVIKMLLTPGGVIVH
jgi:hypothetical protein